MEFGDDGGSLEPGRKIKADSHDARKAEGVGGLWGWSIVRCAESAGFRISRNFVRHHPPVIVIAIATIKKPIDAFQNAFLFLYPPDIETRDNCLNLLD